MSPVRARLQQLRRSGWVPALLVYAITAFVLREGANIGLRGSTLFTVWLLWAHTLPGVILWRAVDWRGRRRESGDHESAPPPATGQPFIEDMVFGTVMGVLATIPIYLAFVSVGIPWFVVFWPLLVIVPAALTGAGRRILVRRQVEHTPTWWSWSMALVMLYVVAYAADTAWFQMPLTPAGLRDPHIDEPYHLAFVAEFRHHFPATVPFVDGTPLEYHWLFYPFAAAATWGSGIEAVAVLRFLAPTMLAALSLLGLAVAAARLSGHRWTALVAAVFPGLLWPLDVFSWTPDTSPWLTQGWLWYRSPTQAIVVALCPLMIVLLAGVLRGTARRPLHWVALFAVMLATAGAKSAMMPLFIAGLAGASVVMVALRRKVPYRVVGLTALATLSFVAAKLIFYGPGSRGLELSPFQFVDRQAESIGLIESGDVATTDVRFLLLLVFLTCTIVPLIGAVGMFVRNGWRQPLPWVLVGAWVAGVGAFHLLAHPAFSQWYFHRSALVPTVIMATLGWARLVGAMTRRSAIVLALATTTGVMWTWLVLTMVPTEAPGPGADAAGELARAFLVPLSVALVGVVAFVLGLRLAATRWSAGKFIAPLTPGLVVAFMVGMSVQPTVATLPDRLDWQHRKPDRDVIGVGGIAAARWLRDNSDPDDLVATNLHSRWVKPADDHRHFWVAGYTERRILVEGWSYIPPASVGLPSTDRNNASTGAPFWDPERLRLNDEVFTDPTAENVAELHERYGVDWLFADRRRKPDLKGLRELADRRYSNETFVVFRIGERDRTSSR